MVARSRPAGQASVVSDAGSHSLAVAFDVRIAGTRFRRQLEPGQKMAAVEQILQHHQRIGAAA